MELCKTWKQETEAATWWHVEGSPIGVRFDGNRWVTAFVSTGIAATDGRFEDLHDAMLAAERVTVAIEDARFTLTFEGAAEPDWAGPIAEWVEANVDTLEEIDVAEALALQPGQELEFGGGAAPSVYLKRVA